MVNLADKPSRERMENPQATQTSQAKTGNRMAMAAPTPQDKDKIALVPEGKGKRKVVIANARHEMKKTANTGGFFITIIS